MFTNCIAVFVAFFCYMLLTHGENAKVPYEFCKGGIKVDASYSINTTNNSIFLTANEYRTILWNYTRVQENCNKTMLELTVERTIKYESDGVSVIYYTVISVKKSFRYNILNETGQCSTIKTCYSAILHVVENRFTNGLNEELTLNIAGNRSDPYSQHFGKMPDCNSCNASCPQGSKETNMECECIPGTHLDVNLTECVLCPRNTYQEESGKFICTPCPPRTKTVNRNGSIFRSNCSSECSSGTYYNIHTKTCTPCPKDQYKNLNDGKITSGVGTKSLNDCEKSSPPPPPPVVLPIVLPIVAIVVLLILALVILVVKKRRNRKLNKKIFKENFEEFVNPYCPDESSDEERNVEQCTALGLLEPEVRARNLEIPRDCIKLTGVRLGRGNFGEVHQVLVKRDGEPEVLCAAKMARGSRISLEDMLDELDIHLKLEKNPNIVNLAGVCSSSDGPFYLIVEYCGNGSLNNYLKEHKKTPHYVNKAASEALSLEWKLHRTLEICNGMKFLSSQKIVHRDLAARNILLDHNTVAKVADFGMAKDVYVKSYYKQRREGSFPLRWMAIEAIQELSFNEKTDIWSYGILVWEIFTDGKLPYYAIINDEKVANYILSGKKLKRPPECPKYLYRIMSKCWKDKDYNRPKFRELYEELDQTIKNEERLNPDRRTNRGSLKTRFKETKRSMSRKLSWRRGSRTSQASTTIEANTSTRNFHKRASRENSLDIDANNSLENVSEDFEVVCDKLNRENTDGTPIVVSEDLGVGNSKIDSDQAHSLNESSKDDQELNSVEKLKEGHGSSCESNEASSLKKSKKDDQRMKRVKKSKPDPCEPSVSEETSKNDQKEDSDKELKDDSYESSKASFNENDEDYGQNVENSEADSFELMESVLRTFDKNDHELGSAEKSNVDSHEPSKASPLKELNNEDQEIKDDGKDEVDTRVNTKEASQGFDNREPETTDSATQERNFVDLDIEDESNIVSQENELDNLESDNELGVLNEGLSIELPKEDNKDTSSAWK